MPASRSFAVGVGLVAAGAVSVQVGAAVAVSLFASVGAAGAVTLRLALAGVGLGLGTLLFHLVRRPVTRTHSAADWGTAVGFGAALAIMNLTFYEAIARIPLGIAVAIELLGPLGLAAATSRRLLDGVWITVALAGVVTLGVARPAEGGRGVTVTGVVFAVLAGVFWALYIVLSARTGARFDRTDGLAVAMVVAGVLVLPVGLSAAGGALVAGTTALKGAAVALLSSLVPYSLDLLALRRIPAATFGVLMSLEPAIAAVAAWLLLDQVLSGPQWLGIVAVVVACVGVTALGRRVPGPVDAPAAVEAA